MNEIEKFVECQKLWQKYENVEKQIDDVGRLLAKTPFTFQGTVIVKLAEVVLQGLQQCEEVIIDEIRQLGWYDEEELTELEEPFIDWEKVFEEAQGEE